MAGVFFAGWGLGSRLRYLGRTRLRDLGRELVGDLVLLLLLIGHPSWIDKSLQDTRDGHC